MSSPTMSYPQNEEPCFPLSRRCPLVDVVALIPALLNVDVLLLFLPLSLPLPLLLLLLSPLWPLLLPLPVGIAADDEVVDTAPQMQAAEVRQTYMELKYTTQPARGWVG